MPHCMGFTCKVVRGFGMIAPCLERVSLAVCLVPFEIRSTIFDE